MRMDIPIWSYCREFPFLRQIRCANESDIYQLHSQKKMMHWLYNSSQKYCKTYSTEMEFTFQVRRKLLTFSLRKLSTSSFILNFSECWTGGTCTEGEWEKTSCFSREYVMSRWESNFPTVRWKCFTEWPHVCRWASLARLLQQMT